MPDAKPGSQDDAVPLGPNPAPGLLSAGVDLDEAETAAGRCTACELYRDATQVVFGEGPAKAKLMLVGEQPGDEEDMVGAPFVGPAGRLLDEILHEVGISRSEVYLTNAVKHFRWEQRGKRRLHQRPTRRQVRACGPWLVLEIELVDPAVIVALGATATQALLGDEVRVMRDHGTAVEVDGRVIIPTVHPSSIPRGSDREARAEMREILRGDLETARGRASPR